MPAIDALWKYQPSSVGFGRPVTIGRAAERAMRILERGAQGVED